MSEQTDAGAELFEPSTDDIGDWHPNRRLWQRIREKNSARVRC
jgi:hypothetical protein